MKLVYCCYYIKCLPIIANSPLYLGSHQKTDSNCKIKGKNLTQSQCLKIAWTTLMEICEEHLSNGTNVEIAGFGIFTSNYLFLI